MNLDDLQNIWAAQSVTGRVDAAQVAAEFERGLRDARRRFLGMIVMAGGLLALSWLVAVGAHASGIKRLTSLETTAHVVGSIFYVGWLALAVRSRRALRQETASIGATARQSAAASLRVVELQLLNYRLAAWILPAAVGAAAVLSFAKHRAGELHGWGALIAPSFLAVLAAFAGAAMWRRCRSELAPRRTALRRLLADLER